MINENNCLCNLATKSHLKGQLLICLEFTMKVLCMLYVLLPPRGQNRLNATLNVHFLTLLGNLFHFSHETSATVTEVLYLNTNLKNFT